MAKLIAWFAKAAQRHAETLEAMQEEAAAAQVEALNRYYAMILREDGTEMFLALLEEEPAVSGMAAVYALRRAPERCLPVLKKLAALPGLMGFRAETAVQRWEAGEWPM